MGLFSTTPRPAVHTLRVLAHLLRYPTAELREHAGEMRDALRGEAALPLVQLDDARNVGADLGTGENLAGGQLDLREDLVLLQPSVTLEDDPVDDRVFLHLDHHVAEPFAGWNDDLRVGRLAVLFQQRQ